MRPSLERATAAAAAAAAFCILPACAELREAPTETINRTAPAPTTSAGGKKLPAGGVTVAADDEGSDGVSESGKHRTRGTSGESGENGDAGSDLTSPDRAVAISAGLTHACALRDSGAVQCWGANSAGQLDVPAGLVATSVSAGGAITCAIRKGDATIACWGGKNVDSIDYLRGTPPGRFTAVAAGFFHACGIAEASKQVACWGLFDKSGAVNAPAGSYVAISAYGHRSCALTTEGAMRCWGAEAEGATAPPVEGTFSSLTVGALTTCGLTHSGEVHCSVAPTVRSEALAHVPSSVFAAVAAGGAAVLCGVTSDESPVCWGEDVQLTLLPIANPVGAIAVGGGGFACGLSRDTGKIRCWGRNDYGALAVPANLVP